MSREKQAKVRKENKKVYEQINRARKMGGLRRRNDETAKEQLDRINSFRRG